MSNRAANTVSQQELQIALASAVRCQDVIALQAVIAKGAFVAGQSDHLRTAFENQDRAMVQVLLEHDAAYRMDKGDLAHYAVKLGDRDIVRQCLAAGALRSTAAEGIDFYGLHPKNTVFAQWLIPELADDSVARRLMLFRINESTPTEVAHAVFAAIPHAEIAQTLEEMPSYSGLPAHMVTHTRTRYADYQRMALAQSLDEIPTGMTNDAPSHGLGL